MKEKYIKIRNTTDSLLNTDDSDFKKEIFEANIEYQNKKDGKIDDESNWWKEKNGFYNQKAHVVLHYLAKNNFCLKKGAYEWYKNYCNLKSESENILHTSNNDNILLLLHYIELYFSCPHCFEYTKDFIDFIQPILDNFYNCYLENCTDIEEINLYCNKLEEITLNVENLKIQNTSSVIADNAEHTVRKLSSIINQLKSKTI